MVRTEFQGGFLATSELMLLLVLWTNSMQHIWKMKTCLFTRQLLIEYPNRDAAVIALDTVRNWIENPSNVENMRDKHVVSHVYLLL